MSQQVGWPDKRPPSDGNLGQCDVCIVQSVQWIGKSQSQSSLSHIYLQLHVVPFSHNSNVSFHTSWTRKWFFFFKNTNIDFAINSKVTIDGTHLKNKKKKNFSSYTTVSVGSGLDLLVLKIISNMVEWLIIGLVLCKFAIIALFIYLSSKWCSRNKNRVKESKFIKIKTSDNLWFINNTW